MTMTTGARYEITVDGPPRTNRDDLRSSPPNISSM